MRWQLPWWLGVALVWYGHSRGSGWLMAAGSVVMTVTLLVACAKAGTKERHP